MRSACREYRGGPRDRTGNPNCPFSAPWRMTRQAGSEARWRALFGFQRKRENLRFWFERQRPHPYRVIDAGLGRVGVRIVRTHGPFEARARRRLEKPAVVPDPSADLLG